MISRASFSASATCSVAKNIGRSAGESEIMGSLRLEGAVRAGENDGLLRGPGVVGGAEVRVLHADGLSLRFGFDGRLERHGVLALEHLLGHRVGERGTRRKT